MPVITVQIKPHLYSGLIHKKWSNLILSQLEMTPIFISVTVQITASDMGVNNVFAYVPGVVKTEDYAGFEDHRQYDRNSYEYQLIVEKDQAEWVEQVVPSPDGKYILYVERIYRGTGTTDDEDVYYKVYSVDDDVRTTIFSGFRQFLLVDWK